MESAAKVYFSIFFLLVVFGMVMVFNINMFNVSSANAALFPQMRSLIFNFAVAGVAFTFAYLINLSWLKNSSKLLVFFMILVLIGTLIVGTKVNGARRWIDLGFMRVQPSEFAKIVTVIYLSEVMTKKGERIRLIQDLISIGIVIGLMLLFMYNDMGALVIIAGTSVCLLLLGGVNRKQLFLLAAPLSVIAVLALLFSSDYRITRVKSFIDPCGEEYRAGAGYQQCHARIAFSIGGTTGVGFGNSTEKKKTNLPEAQTDFIFPIIGEEFGFVGSLTMIFLFLAMFGIGSYFALNLHDTFNFYMVSGFVLMLAGQAAINLLMVVSLLPNKGEPLPFISYGGSALTSYSIMVGLILNAVTSESRR